MQILSDYLFNLIMNYVEIIVIIFVLTQYLLIFPFLSAEGSPWWRRGVLLTCPARMTFSASETFLIWDSRIRLNKSRFRSMLGLGSFLYSVIFFYSPYSIFSLGSCLQACLLVS